LGINVLGLLNAVSQLPWPDKDREVWFFLKENHEVCRFGLHQLRNLLNGRHENPHPWRVLLHQKSLLR
jgi:hypothetical protein